MKEEKKNKGRMREGEAFKNESIREKGESGRN
jgi:hypothetical protein